MLRGRSSNWRFAGIECSLAQLRDAASAADGTINDAFLAALLGGYQRYHQVFGVEVEAIPMSIPVSSRTESDPDGGNLFVPARLAGPLNIADPSERIREVNYLVRNARREPVLDHLNRAAPALAMLPAPTIAKVASTTAKTNDLQASNVRGTSDPVHLGEILVERFYPFAPSPAARRWSA